MTSLYTLSEGAERLRISEKTLRKLIKERKVKALRLVSGKILMTEHAIEDAIAAAAEWQPSAPLPA